MINEIYKQAVKEICSMFGSADETDEIELSKVGRHLFGDKFSGVYPADEEIDFSGKKCYAIINLDPSFMPGSHWVALIKGKNKYFGYDSFGRPLQKILPDTTRKLTAGGKKNIINSEDDAEQKVTENSCGQRSLASIFIFDQFGPEAFLKL